MSGLGAGLARGLAMYGQGRMIAEQREYERQQQAAQAKRQSMLDDRTAAQMQAQAEHMRWQREQAEAQAKRQQEADARDAYEGGYRRADDAAKVGGAMQASGAGLGLMGNAVDAAAGYGRQMQQAAQAPAFTMGGTPMVKTAESLVERVQRLQAQQRDSERVEERKWLENRDEAHARQQAARDRSLFGQQMALQGQRLNADGAQPPKVSLPTVEERKASALYRVAEQGYSTLESLITRKDNTGKPVMGSNGQPVYKAAPSLKDKVLQTLGGGVGNVMTGDEYRQMTQAANQMADMWLRYTSGAAVPETEVARFAQTFTPLPGDDPQTLQQKAAARRTMLEALRGGAGRALQSPAGAGNQPSAGELAQDTAQPTTVRNPYRE